MVAGLGVPIFRGFTVSVGTGRHAQTVQIEIRLHQSVPS